MTKEELAAMLDGRQYRNETTREIERIAEENDLLIIFWYSDDLCEFRGAIHDEFGCFDGGEIKSKDLRYVFCIIMFQEVFQFTHFIFYPLCVKATYCPNRSVFTQKNFRVSRKSRPKANF